MTWVGEEKQLYLLLQSTSFCISTNLLIHLNQLAYTSQPTCLYISTYLLFGQLETKSLACIPVTDDRSDSTFPNFCLLRVQAGRL